MVSIVLPTFNRPNFLKLVLETIYNQTYKDWELIIIDDHSDEDKFKENIKLVLPLCRGNNERVKFIVLDENSESVSIPRNIGISFVGGDFICPADDDVLWEPNKLEVLVAALDERPDAMLAYGQRYNAKCNSNGDIIISNKSQVIADPNWNPMNTWGVDNGQIIYRRNFYDYMPLVFAKRACDYETAKIIWCFKSKFVFVDKFVCTYLWHDTNRSLDENTKTKTIYPKKFEKYFNPEFMEKTKCKLPESV